MSMSKDNLSAAIAYVQKTDRTEDEYIQGYLRGVEDALRLAMEAKQGREA
jgi:hypothetical protein